MSKKDITFILLSIIAIIGITAVVFTHLKVPKKETTPTPSKTIVDNDSDDFVNEYPPTPCPKDKLDSSGNCLDAK